MDKQKILEMLDRHRKLFQVAFAVVNRIPFNNSWGGGENLILDCPSYRTAKLSTEVRIIESSSVIIPD